MRHSRRLRAATHADENGFVVIFFALLLVAMMTLVAIVIDQGNLRYTRRDNQSIADFAALAAGSKLSQAPRDPIGACTDAFNYVVKNTPDLPAGTTNPCTTQMDADCDPANPPATVASGSYVITIRYPVLPSTITDSRFSGGVGIHDGTLCERMMVSVQRTNSSYFAGVLGVKSQAASGSAVVRQRSGTNEVAPALWLLDPYGCVALSVSGGANVTVGTDAITGLVTLDSDASKNRGGSGSCSNGAPTLSVSGAGTKLTALPPAGNARGQIALRAMPAGATSCGTAVGVFDCTQADVDQGRVSPQPLPREDRATRAPVDHVYDCKKNYPNFYGIEIRDCPESDSRLPYITQLEALQTMTMPPAGFTTVTDCNPSGTVTYAGNVWVDCNTFRVQTGSDVTFSGGNVIFKGDVVVQGVGVLNINTANPSASLPENCLASITGCFDKSSQQAAFVYMRSGKLDTNAFITLNRVAVYQADGVVDMQAGTTPIWNAPLEGPLQGLALWSEKVGGYKVTGGANMSLEGVFFTPNAQPMSLSGSGNIGQQAAQFVSFQLAISGGFTMTMVPNPDNSITLPPPAGVLIR